MAILYHAYHSRSSGMVALIDELGADIEIREVTVPRMDGGGARDPVNPHPEGKVPYLVDGDERLRERGAIILYLTDKYPEAGLGPVEGQPGRGAYLSWLFYYQGVIEPVVLLKMTELSHPLFDATLRDFDTVLARLNEALAQGPWLLGERFSAADLLCSAAFQWLPQLVEDQPLIRDWVKRCSERPAMARTLRRDSEAAARAA